MRGDATVRRTFAPAGDAFSGLIIPIVESATDALVSDELARVRQCDAAGCERVYFDSSKNGRRRWCDMRGCGNRAKGAQFRARNGARTRTPQAKRR
jgi:predicted RNA-binding Zn ribbon-like protein